MTKTLILLLISSFSLLGCGQCKNGFVKTKVNGQKVRIPCINSSEAKGLSLEITNSNRSADSVLIDIVFENKVDSTRSIYWYDFVDSWGIPLSFSFSVTDSNGKTICNKLNWADYMDNSVFYSHSRINQKIEIEPNHPFERTIRVWWPSISKGSYELTLFYGGIDFELTSNKLIVEIK